MTTAQLVLIIGLVVIAAILIAVILRRGSQRRDEHRVEAAEMRSEAQEVMAAVAGQTTFAQQADERADVARSEAEEAAREAERLEAEAAERHRAAEASRQEYEAMMRRADDIDPDVKESEFPPVPEDAAPEPAPEPAADEPVGEESEVVPEHAEAPEAVAAAPADEDQPMTRAERRRAREEAEGRDQGWQDADEEESWAGGPAAPIAGAAAAAAVGTAAWAAHDDERTDEEQERSSRIASAADYRDDTDDRPQEQVAGPEARGSETTRARRQDEDDYDARAADQFDVWAPAPVGTAAGMSQSPHDDVTDSTDHSDHSDLHDADHGDAAATDAAADAESPSGEWGGPRDGEDTGPAPVAGTDHPTTEEDTMSDQDADQRSDAEGLGHEPTPMTMVDDTESYASTEPVLAADQAAPVEPPETAESGTGLLRDEPGTDEDASGEGHGEDLPAAGATADEHTTLDEAEEEGTDAVILADTDRYATTEPTLADGSSAPPREEWEAGATGADEAAVEERDDAAADGIVAADADDEESRDWGRSEGDRLEENRERGEQLAADREALDREAAGDEAVPAREEPAAGSDDAPATDDIATGDAATEESATDGVATSGGEVPRGRRVSDFHEIRDGGFGVGSAAPLEDGAQPMDHPIAGYRDTMSFRTPDDAGYDDAEPDVWFYDEGAAERSGFHRSDG